MPQKKALALLFLVVATELVGFGLIVPVLPQIAYNFQSHPLLLGVLMASYSFAQFFSSPILGSLSDRYGRKPLLVLSKLGSVFGYVLMAFSGSFSLLLIARLIDGFTGGNISVARAYVADVTDASQRSRGMAVIGIAFGTGFVLGPAIGGLLYSPVHGHFYAALVAGGLSLLATVLTWILLPEPESKQILRERYSFSDSIRSIKRLIVMIILLVYFGYMLVFSGFETTFSLFTHKILDFSVKDNSLLFMYIGFLGFFIQGGIMRFTIKRLGLFTTLGCLITGVSMILLSQVTSSLQLFFVLALFSLGIGFINAFLPSFLSVNIDSTQQGMVMGLYESIGSLSRVLGPFVAYSFLLSSPRVGYFVFGIFMILFGLIVLFSRSFISSDVDT